MDTKNCQKCLKIFERKCTPSNWKRIKYCSQNCYWVAKQGCIPWNKGKGTPRGYDVRNTRKYRTLRVSVIIKAEHRCQTCGSASGRLEVDHIKPIRFYPDLVWDEGNMRVLCRECHKKTPTYGTKVFSHGHSK